MHIISFAVEYSIILDLYTFELSNSIMRHFMFRLIFEKQIYIFFAASGLKIFIIIFCLVSRPKSHIAMLSTSSPSDTL